MPYYAELDGVSGLALCGSALSLPPDFEIDYDLFILANGSEDYFSAPFNGRGIGFWTSFVAFYASTQQVYFSYPSTGRPAINDIVNLRVTSTDNGDSTFTIRCYMSVNGGTEEQLNRAVGNDVFSTPLSTRPMEWGRRPNTIFRKVGVIRTRYYESGVLKNDWDFNQSSGNTAPDLVGNNPATLSGGFSWIFYDDGSTGVDYTITLDSGNYLLQGSDLSLLSDRNLILENGSYTLTGQELSLTLQRSITLSQGVYSQQGTNPTLTVNRLLGLNTGSYSYLGEDINLQYGRVFRLSLEQGSYSLHGSNTSLLKDYIITIEPDSYDYAPESISLLTNRKILADSGEYSYSGSPINFIYESGGITYTLSLDSGNYSLTGESLGLLTSRRLPIDFGAYTYEGVDSKLLYNRVVALNSGLYSSAGTDLGIKVNRRLVFGNGNYSLQGTPITLSYSGEVLAILEGYNLSYKKHPVQSKYKTYNITARYN